MCAKRFGVRQSSALSASVKQPVVLFNFLHHQYLDEFAAGHESKNRMLQLSARNDFGQNSILRRVNQKPELLLQRHKIVVWRANHFRMTVRKGISLHEAAAGRLP